ncbi:Uncharacterised protein [Mycobacterium tuberculosis]|nr:Uncharacterised protein [Mycobacterium tuberculosis]
MKRSRLIGDVKPSSWASSLSGIVMVCSSIRPSSGVKL